MIMKSVSLWDGSDHPTEIGFDAHETATIIVKIMLVKFQTGHKTLWRITTAFKKCRHRCTSYI